MITNSTSADLDDIRRLFLEYQESLGFTLCFQGFDEELATLPGKYSEPKGALLIARDESGTALGCVALRPTEDAEACEMKRLYVSPSARGQRLGSQLMDAIMAEARQRGYTSIRLDTVPGKMDRAIAMYRAAGFEEIPAFYSPPMEVIFLGKRL